MPDVFHRSPILNSPYEVPARHWELDEERQPTDIVGDGRRKVSFISPIPKARKAGGMQAQFVLDAESEALETREQQYQLIALIDSLRRKLADWRALPEGQWLKECLVCKGDTRPAQLMIADLADIACERISAAITRAELGRQPVKALLDPYNPIGATRHVNFTTSRTQRYAAGGRCHLNWAILDSGWEGELCRIFDAHPQVLAWVKNHNLGFEVPYQLAGENRRYIPDFIALVDDGRGADDPLHLVAEVKGYRGEDAKAKKETMDTYWVPGINAHGCYGRWAFVELRDVHTMQDDLAAKVTEMIETWTVRRADREPRLAPAQR